MESILLLVGYIAVTCLIAMSTARANKTSREFFVGSAGLGVAFVVSMIFSETIGGTGTVGQSADAMASIGMGAVWSTWGMALGCILFVLVFGKFYKVLGATRGVASVAGAYNILFGPKMKTLMLIVVAFVYACLFALQPVAAAALLAPMFGLNQGLVYFAVGGLFIVVACLGGLKGLAKMNVVHAFVMWVGLLVVALLAVSACGGPTVLAGSVPEGYLNPFYPGLITVGTWCVGAVLSQMSSAIMATVTLSTDTYRSMKKGTLIAGVLLLVFALFPAIIGVCGLVLSPDVAPASAIYAVSSGLNPWIGALCSVAIIAAIFSTAPSLLLIVGTTIAQDLYRGTIRTNASDANTMRVARLSMIVVGVVSLIAAAETSSLFAQLMNIFQVRSIASVVLIVALVWPRVSERAAFWSVTLGVGVAVIWWFLANPFGIQPLIPSLIVGSVVLVVATALSCDKVSAGYRRYLVCQQEYAAMDSTDITINETRIQKLLGE